MGLSTLGREGLTKIFVKFVVACAAMVCYGGILGRVHVSLAGKCHGPFSGFLDQEVAWERAFRFY